MSEMTQRQRIDAVLHRQKSDKVDVVGEFPGVEFRLVKEKNFSIATDFHG